MKTVILGIVWISGIAILSIGAFLMCTGTLLRLENVIAGFLLVVIGTNMWIRGYCAYKKLKLTVLVQQKEVDFLKEHNFNEDIKIPVNRYRTFILDYNNHRIFVTPIFHNVKSVAFNKDSIFDLDNMRDVTLRENKKTIAQTKGGLAGAIVGLIMDKKTTTKTQITSLNINILTRNYKVPLWTIKFLDAPESDISIYNKSVKNAERIYLVLRNWLLSADERKIKKVSLKKDERNTEQKSIEETGQFEKVIITEKTFRKLRAYKELLDDGVINQEEFNAMKKRLLEFW